MKRTAIRTKKFQEACQRLAPRLHNTVNRKIQMLLTNPVYPSLQSHRVVRLPAATDLWICYLSANLRLLYQQRKEVIYQWDVGTHAIVDQFVSKPRRLAHLSPPNTK